MSHPQKYYLKIISKALFLLGLGDVWYETKPTTHHHKVLYNIYFTIINISNYILLLNEVLAAVVITENFNYYIQVSIAYLVISVKAVIVHHRKDRIKKVLERLLENNRELYQMCGSDNEGVSKAKKYCYAMIIGVYSTFMLTTANAAWAHLTKGTPIRTLATLYPDASQSGTITNVCHFIVEIHSWYTVSIMVFIDSLCFCCLIFTQFKFRAVNTYFSNLRENLLVWNNDQGVLEKDFKEDFVIGVKLHEDALWCARNIQHALGNVFNVQILLSMTLLATCMIEILMSQRNVVTVLSGLFSLLTVLILTGSYMFASGDVTYEASLIPIAIFQSGWELKRSSCKLRTLLVVALLRAQAPVRMRAFGIIDLSYRSFISVLRASYSCFALIY